jgi:hypothetical protein
MDEINADTQAAKIISRARVFVGAKCFDGIEKYLEIFVWYTTHDWK